MRRRISPQLATLLAWTAASPALAAEDLDIFPDLSPTGPFAILLVLFVVLIPLSNVLVFKPLLRVLEERRVRIEGARAQANELAASAAAALQKYEAAITAARVAAEGDRRGLLEEARRAQAQAQAEARASAEREIAQVRAEVTSGVAIARKTLRADAEDLAREIAAQVLGRNVA
jgi:F-type H+-transporting ATPase subunit b